MNPDDFFMFVCIVMTIAAVTWVVTSVIRNRHALKMAQVAALRTAPEAERTVHLLTNENERLVGQVSRLEDRIAVLERIATDPAVRTHHAIEALR